MSVMPVFTKKLWVNWDFTHATQALEDQRHIQAHPIMCLTRNTPVLSPARWSELDKEINKSISNLHHLLGHNQLPNDEAADQFGMILSDFLKTQPEFQEVEKEFFF